MEYEKNKISDLTNYLATEFYLDSDEIIEMLDIFFDSTATLISTAENHLADLNVHLLATTGHALKGSAANINATGISNLGAALETAGKANDLTKCKEILNALQISLAELKSEYQK